MLPDCTWRFESQKKKAALNREVSAARSNGSWIEPRVSSADGSLRQPAAATPAQRTAARQPGGPFRLRFPRTARRRGPPGGVGSGIGRIGRALKNSASMISGLVHPSGPQRVNRCSLIESSLVNRRTTRGDGPSIDGTTVSSRATSSATHRRPLGSVYRAANARRFVWSMSSWVSSGYRKSKDRSRSLSGASVVHHRD